MKQMKAMYRKHTILARNILIGAASAEVASCIAAGNRDHSRVTAVGVNPPIDSRFIGRNFLRFIVINALFPLQNSTATQRLGILFGLPITVSPHGSMSV